ncbi:putative MFS multidrug transporter [Peziza echinospora]|nr:putative MFS multidrug transporter [Peziza echinospora]
MSPPHESTPLLSGGDGGEGAITAYTTPILVSNSDSITKPNGATAAVDEESSPVRSDQQDPDVPLIPGVRLEYIVPAMAVGIFLAALDNTIVVASYGRIGTEMKELNRTSWISTAYLLTTTSFQPLYGRLSDIFGRKACLLFAYTVFGIGCLLCGLSSNMTQLVASRAVAGIGGGGMTTVASILMSDVVALRKRGTWQGILNIVFACGSAIGGPLGGFLADTVGWRWAFLGQAPLTLIAILVVSTMLHLPPAVPKPGATAQDMSTKARLKRVDFAGALTLVTAIFTFLVSLDLAANSLVYTITSPLTLSLLGGSITLFTAFYFIELSWSAEPFCPPAVVKRREVFSPCVANFCSFGGFFIILFHIPLYYQAAMGTTAAVAGQRLIPAIIGGVVGSLAGGIYMQKTGNYYWLTFWSYFILFAGSAVMATFMGISATWLSADLRVWILNTAIMCMGFGNGIGVTSTLIALISNASSAEQAVVTAISYLFRSLGSVLGLSVSAGLIQRGLRRRLVAELGSGKAAEKIIQRVRTDLDSIWALDPKTALVVRRSYQGAVSETILFSVVLCLGAWVASWWIREVRVKK